MPRKLTEEELALFQAAVKGVKPLKQTDQVQLEKKPPLKRRIMPRRSMVHEKTMVNELSDHLTETVTTEQILFFSQPGLPPKLLRDLKHGKIKQGAILDLHGCTVNRARDALLRMINACMQRGIRCFRVIHGKGKLQNTNQPVLKNQVNNWLQQHPYILAFCSAQPIDGGAGAAYVLLKNSTKLER